MVHVKIKKKGEHRDANCCLFAICMRIQSRVTINYGRFLVILIGVDDHRSEFRNGELIAKLQVKSKKGWGLTGGSKTK